MTERAELERRLMQEAELYSHVPSWDVQLVVIYRQRFHAAALALADAIRKEEQE